MCSQTTISPELDQNLDVKLIPPQKFHYNEIPYDGSSGEGWGDRDINRVGNSGNALAAIATPVLIL